VGSSSTCGEGAGLEGTRGGSSRNRTGAFTMACVTVCAYILDECEQRNNNNNNNNNNNKFDEPGG
jgi:hypothetical protein